LAKPFAAGELVEAVRSCVERRNAKLREHGS
jgi:hypothetical protein